MLQPDASEIEFACQHWYAPHLRPGFVLRCQMFGARSASKNEQWRLMYGAPDAPFERKMVEISGRQRPLIWHEKGVPDLEHFIKAAVYLAERANSYGAGIGIAMGLYHDSVQMTANDLASWWGLGLDFDDAAKGQVGPTEGLKRLAASPFKPLAIAETGGLVINGRGIERRFHAWFRFDPPVPQAGVERARHVVRAFTRAMGADPGCADPTRAFRLPGTVHHGEIDERTGEILAEPRLCRLVFLEGVRNIEAPEE
jgi:hypothetical protein